LTLRSSFCSLFGRPLPIILLRKGRDVLHYIAKRHNFHIGIISLINTVGEYLF
jgi:hypothetical protein